MENRKVGFLIIAISALIGFIIYSFNAAMSQIIATSCSHGSECPMWGTLNFQNNVSLGVMVFVIAIGFYLVIFGSEKKVYTRVMRPQVRLNDVTRENFEGVIKKLDSDEKQIFGHIIDEKGSVFQSSLVEKSGMSKVKVTRLLDRLEGKGLVERKRRGMINMVVLKH
jgi:uncharacterized membrane protein